MLDRLDRIPPPQREAIERAFGVSGGPPPDRFLISLAFLSLLSEVAQDEPLICLIDDYQWLDFASATTVAFAARRLGAESVGLVIASRSQGSRLSGLSALELRGLRDADARALLESVLPRKLDSRIRDQIVAESRGNPLALLELPKVFTPAEMALGFELPGAVTLAGRIEESFRQRVSDLPEQTRRLLLVASAEPTGDPILLWQAAARLGIGLEAAGPAEKVALAEFSTRIRFRHPLVRSAVYVSASPDERRQVHRVLAEVTDPEVDSERRAWHRSQAAPGPDEEIAMELESAAGQALARGCLAAAGAYLERATSLSLLADKRAQRALAAAEGKIRAGDFDTALDLLAFAEVGPLTEFQLARVDLVRAQLAFVTNRGSDATPLLLKAAQRLEPVDAALSRATYLEALSAAIFAGRLAEPGGGIPDVVCSVENAELPRTTTRVLDHLLDGLVDSTAREYPDGVRTLRKALEEFGADMTADEQLGWFWLAAVAAMRIWDDERWEWLSSRHVEVARETGALSELPLALLSQTYFLIFAGEHAAATSLNGEMTAVIEATGSNLIPYGALGLAAFRGGENEVLQLIESSGDDLIRRGEGVGITFAEWAKSLLNNGLGKYDQALTAAQRATAYHDDVGSTIWPLVELIEAAARVGKTGIALDAYERFAVMSRASGTDWALGLEARSHALLVDTDEADTYYREAIDRLGRTRMRTDLARAHLVYGEWTRRRRRPSESREHLRIAHAMFVKMGMDAFAERTSGELLAAGETVRQRSFYNRHNELTAQEAQIARLARDGLTNPEIATRLFISAHTVQYHLRKVFAKLGITSRSQLDRVLPSR
jgi:DNA-binding CsgD family transcriptional regulator